MGVLGKALIAAVWLAFRLDCAYSQENCDRTVKGVDDPQGYRQRGDRCEGLYLKAHAQETGLYLTGLTRGGAAERAAMPDPVQLQWGKRPTIPPQTGVSIRSVLLRSDRYYQMDTSKPYSSGSYAWPTDVLRALQLAPKDLGIYAFTSVKIGRTPWKVYRPVTL